MTAQTQSTQIFTDCKVDENGYLHLTGSFDVQANITPSASELDQIVDLSDQISQLVMQTSARPGSPRKSPLIAINKANDDSPSSPPMVV